MLGGVRLKIAIPIVVLLMVTCPLVAVVAAPARPAAKVTAQPAPHDMGRPLDAARSADLAVPTRLTRPLSDAFNYNRLQITVIQQQLDRMNNEMSRLLLERAKLGDQLEREYQINVARGDYWDERTLEIYRSPRP